MKNKARIIIWIIMIPGGIIFSLLCDVKYFKELLFSPIFHLISFVLGILLLKAVITISRNTGRTLAKYGRKGNIPRMETNTLVDKGPYAYMRHPMHLGLLFFPLSIALLLGLPSFIIFIAPVEAIFMLIMIKYVEEPEARKKFGEAYDKYAKDKPWFCIKPECLKALFTQGHKEK